MVGDIQCLAVKLRTTDEKISLSLSQVPTASAIEFATRQLGTCKSGERVMTAWGTSRQDAGQRFEGHEPHQDVVAEGKGSEMFQIFRQAQAFAAKYSGFDSAVQIEQIADRCEELLLSQKI